jgi:hypothetical protein
LVSPVFLALVDAEVEGPTDFVEVQMTAGQGRSAHQRFCWYWAKALAR